MARAAGSKNRNYPSMALADALRMPTAIEDQASGMSVSRLTLAELLDVSPSSSNFRELAGSSRLYGLTAGGINADEFGLTDLGRDATGGDEIARIEAYKKAVLTISPYKAFFEAFANKKVPGPAAFKEFLIKSGQVAAEHVEECMAFILADGATAGMIRSVKGSDYIDLTGAAAVVAPSERVVEPAILQVAGEGPPETGEELGMPPAPPTPPPAGSGKPKKVFIAHGKNRTPLEQLKKALDQFKVSYAVAFDEPNKGRPISKKVANLMQDECSSGIFIFTADERFLREADGANEEVWRPSENVIYELGAASILYDNRIVIFKEKGVSFPSDFSDLGYIEFEKDKLVAELGSLFSELVGLDILEVRAKS